jgi:hypothetical protein
MQTRILFMALILAPCAARAQEPRTKFAVEERVTMSAAVVLGDTALGYRQEMRRHRRGVE